MFHNHTTTFFQSTLTCLFVTINIIGCFSSASTADTFVFPDLTANPPLKEYQSKLLVLAFETATTIPVEPHIKDRSRAQEAVVQALLRLHQPKQAIEWIAKIENWRQGSCYADLAYYCVENKLTHQVEALIELAQQSGEDEEEDWRKDQIKVKIAQTYLLMGDTQKAEQFAKGVVESESGKVEQTAAQTIGDASFDVQMQELDQLIALGGFDVVKNSLVAYVELFDRFFNDHDKRSAIVDKIRSSWEPMPVSIRIELLHTLTEKSLQHANQEQALSLLLEARQMIGEYNWSLEHYFPMMAQWCSMRSQAGDKEQARLDADTLLAQYQENREHIVNIWRAGALRPLAETYLTIGDTAAALAIYKQAVEEGMENPNSRPRAEDLSATCVSMALHEMEPDDGLWKRMYEIQKGLSDPW